MSPTTFDSPAIQAFLATKEVVVLATVRPDGGPLAKVQNLWRDARVCVVAEAGTRGDIRGVIVQGRAEFLPDGAERRALVDRFHARYAPDLGRLWNGRVMPADRVMFRIVPSRVRGWGLGE